MCVQITGKLVLCKFSADNEDKTSIFFGVSKVARGHNFVSRYPMNDWCPVQDMMRRHVPRLTSSFSLRRQNVVHFVTIKAGERCLSHRLRTSSAATYIPVRAEPELLHGRLWNLFLWRECKRMRRVNVQSGSP